MLLDFQSWHWPHYSLLNTPTWNSSLTCRSNCSVKFRDGQRLADLFLLPSGFQRLFSDVISSLQCRPLLYPEQLRCSSLRIVLGTAEHSWGGPLGISCPGLETRRRFFALS